MATGEFISYWFECFIKMSGRSSMAEQKLPKLTTGVRFSSPAPVVMAAHIGVTLFARLAKST